jgi:allantoin racemase
MKIRYLSLSATQYASNYYPFLRDYLERVKAPGTEIELSGTRVGRIDSFRFFEFLDRVSILDQVIAAEQDGFDGVAIGNVLDPGLREARSMVDIPVLGLAETCMLQACTMGNQFSLIAVNRFFIPRFRENIATYRLDDRLSSIETMSLTPHELDRSFAEDEYRTRAIDEFKRASRSAIEKGAEVIIPAGGRLTAFLNAHEIRQVEGVPVIDGTSTIVVHAEAAIRLHRLTGRSVSRQGLYAKAPEELLRSAAKQYGDAYALPALSALGSDAEEPSLST